MSEKLYPIGIQSFEKLRTNGFCYVDKTALIYEMVRKGCVYFLARPRRFGKSLLISTMEAYFSGRKDLFKGLAIEKLEQDWTQYPVLHFDMSRAKVDNVTLLKASLDAMLSDYAAIYGDIPETANENFLLRMSKLIANAKNKTGKNVVVLIDEYNTALFMSCMTGLCLRNFEQF